jgi:hypothetical protein
MSFRRRQLQRLKRLRNLVEQRTKRVRACVGISHEKKIILGVLSELVYINCASLFLVESAGDYVVVLKCLLVSYRFHSLGHLNSLSI